MPMLLGDQASVGLEIRRLWLSAAQGPMSCWPGAAWGWEGRPHGKAQLVKDQLLSSWGRLRSHFLVGLRTEASAPATGAS